MKSFKNYFATILVALALLAPAVGLADYGDTVRILGQVRALESSAGSLIFSDSSLSRSFDSLYQAVIDLLKTDLANLRLSITSSISFNPITSSINRGSLTSISFTRAPLGSSSPINFYIEADNKQTATVANQISSDSFSWQVPDKFATGKTFFIIARDYGGNLLGRSGAFTVTGAAISPSIQPPAESVQSSTPSLQGVVQGQPSYIPTAAEISAADINLGSIGFWSFDTGSNSCVTKGGAVTNASGKFGSALGLNGADAYCQISNNRYLYPKNFTLALWAKSSPQYSAGWNDSGWFVSLRDQSGFDIGPIKGKKDVQFTIFDDTNLVQIPYVVGAVTPGDITGWHHYAMSYDGATAKVYLDGVLMTSTTTAISRSYSGTKDFYFGLDGDSVSEHYGAGTLDEIRLYNRSLSSCEIQILAGKGCGGLSLASFAGRNVASLLDAFKK